MVLNVQCSLEKCIVIQKQCQTCQNKRAVSGRTYKQLKPVLIYLIPTEFQCDRKSGKILANLTGLSAYIIAVQKPKIRQFY